jgi:O-acetyl-ADP-ribose deacetylase (regulator of RNase III)
VTRIQIIRGDILALCKEGWLVHGVNAAGKMNAGLAQQVKEQYPLAYKDYRFAFAHGKLMLGSFTGEKVNDKFFVINAVTQLLPGAWRRQTDYGALQAAFGAIVQYASTSEAAKDVPMLISFHKIGCGLGGGKWEEVQKRIEAAVPPHWELRLYVEPGHAAI